MEHITKILENLEGTSTIKKAQNREHLKEIHTEVDTLFLDEQEPMPQWAKELKAEIQELKEAINNLVMNVKYNPKAEVSSTQKVRKDDGFYKFLNQLRKQLTPNLESEILPKIKYKDKLYAMDSRGLIYNVDTTYFLTRENAFELYSSLYSQYLLKGKIDIVY